MRNYRDIISIAGGDMYMKKNKSNSSKDAASKMKKPLYKKWWFWIIVVLAVGSLIGGGNDNTNQHLDKDIAQVEGPAPESPPREQNADDSEVVPQATGESQFDGYTIITVDGGDMSGKREANVAVDIGFGDREYWAFTNEYGQLVRVIAKEIIPQVDSIEPVNSNGRYYNDEAKVPGTELANYDQGHIIADSLGGVSNAYNITPQDSTLNRHGDQAYMEKNIRDAGGCTDFVAIITYPDTKTQIPSHYRYTYTLRGNVIVDDFDNVNPDEANKRLIESQKDKTAASAASVPAPAASIEHDLASVDANGNGKVTIAEAKAAGYKMPITRDHWLYQYMDDRDGDGMVGE